MLPERQHWPKWRNGRRSGLKIRRPKGREGSSPSFGTGSAISHHRDDERRDHDRKDDPDRERRAGPSRRRSSRQSRRRRRWERGAKVSWQWFEVFGAKPLLGRVFTPEEDQPHTDQEVVLAYNTWKTLFGAHFDIGNYGALAPLLILYAITAGIYSLSSVIITYEMSRKIANTSWLQLAFSGAMALGIYILHQTLHQVIVIQLVLMIVLLFVLTCTVSSSRVSDAPPVDWPGAALIGAAVALFVFGILEAPTRGWTHPVVYGSIAAGLAFAVLFGYVELRRRQV